MRELSQTKDKKMRIASPTDTGKEIYEINTTVDALVKIADSKHLIVSMAAELKVECSVVGTWDTAQDMVSNTDCMFFNGKIMVINECTGKYEDA